jgi:hypothetical protein
MSSVKNFQLCMEPNWYNRTLDSSNDSNLNNEEKEDKNKNDITLQFGKVSSDRFTLDVQYPLSVYQVGFKELFFAYYYIFVPTLNTGICYLYCLHGW